MIMQQEMTTRIYSETETTRTLATELPSWSLRHGCLWRQYPTLDWAQTLMLVATIGQLAEAANHHPELIVSYASVIVKLMTHSVSGISDKDFTLAKKIEEVVMRPPITDDTSLK
ncbi:MAG: 4a-hydroxytetrahydrobiopterin dehydratase [Methylovulum sp.]|jgi:4a-hydroxytetrahydrobiopterin dehydratase|nr:4a-hydroxytetrahydrobiopterin dehydratase [Methylovulum sp.]